MLKQKLRKLFAGQRLSRFGDGRVRKATSRSIKKATDRAAVSGEGDGQPDAVGLTLRMSISTSP